MGSDGEYEVIGWRQFGVMKDQASQGDSRNLRKCEGTVRYWVDGMKYTPIDYVMGARMSGYDVGGSSSRRLFNRVYIIRATKWGRKTGAELSVSGASDVRRPGYT